MDLCAVTKRNFLSIFLYFQQFGNYVLLSVVFFSLLVTACVLFLAHGAVDVIVNQCEYAQKQYHNFFLQDLKNIP